MGCVVNGPGEAREADLGVASGNGKGQIFVKGEVIKTVQEGEIVETLLDEAKRIADEMGEDVPSRGAPSVSVGWAAHVPARREGPTGQTGRRPSLSGAEPHHS